MRSVIAKTFHENENYNSSKIYTGCCIYGETIYHALNRVNFAGKYKLVWLSGRILQAIFAAYNDLFQI